MRVIDKMSSTLAVAVALVSSAALAQEAPAAAEAKTEASESGNADNGLDIIVTAQKREQTLQNVPIAVSTIGQSQLDATGAKDIKGALTTVPSVSQTVRGLAIRGLGTATLLGSSPTVAFHLDGVYQNSTVAAGGTLYDIERIEVLRGPQGTLYGRNATAGVVNVITQPAVLGKRGVMADVSYSSFNTIQARAALNVPLGDTLAARVTAVYDKGDMPRLLPDGRRPDGLDRFFVRLGLNWEPTDSIKWKVNATYAENRSVGTPYSITAVGRFPAGGNPEVVFTGQSPKVIVEAPGNGTPGLTSALADDFGLPFTSVYPGGSFEERNRNKSDDVSVRSNLTVQLAEALSATYLMGFVHREVDLSNCAIVFACVSGRSQEREWSHELDFNIEAGRLHGVIGLYSYQIRTDNRGSLGRIWQAALDPTTRLAYLEPLVDTSSMGGSELQRTRAIFGQFTYDLTDELRLIGGARYNWDRVALSEQTSSSCPFGSGIDAARPNEALLFGFLPQCSLAASFSPAFFVNRVDPAVGIDFEKFSYRAAVEYDLAPDVMVYGSVATGYKAGGIGNRDAVDVDDRFFRPEKNINYELGLRGKFFDNTLGLNLTAFWTDYTDLQINSVVEIDGSPTSVFKNAGKARSRGVELEYNWVPTPNDRFSGYVTYLDARFTSFEGADDPFRSAPGSDPVPQDFTGNRLAGAPEFQIRGSYSHVFDFGDIRLTPTISGYYQSKNFTFYTNGPETEVSGYFQGDLLVRLETRQGDGTAYVEGFVNNVTDNRVVVSSTAINGVNFGMYSPPRTIGARVGFKF